MITPFEAVIVYPSWGESRATVIWRLKPGFEKADIFIYRSETGGSDWEMLNNEEAVPNVGWWSDPDLVPGDRLSKPHYRLLLELDGQKYDSPVITSYANLDRREQGVLRCIMTREYNSMKFGRNGVEILHYHTLRKGTPAPGYDPQTRQKTGFDCKDPALDSFGQSFVGGYHTPTRTWMRFLKAPPVKQGDDPAGTGTDEVIQRPVRLMPFPVPHPMDLIICPDTNDRYAVGDTISPFRMHGLVPIAFEVVLSLIDRGDDRYRVPVPNLQGPA